MRAGVHPAHPLGGLHHALRAAVVDAPRNARTRTAALAAPPRPGQAPGTGGNRSARSGPGTHGGPGTGSRRGAGSNPGPGSAPSANSNPGAGSTHTTGGHPGARSRPSPRGRSRAARRGGSAA